MTVTDGRDFFISYAGPDGAWARWVAWQLQEAGYTVELAEWDWGVGQNFVDRMSAGLKRATRVVALLSGAYFEPGRFTRAEWTAVQAVRDRGEDRLLPFRIEEFPDGVLPDELRALVYRDLFGLPEDRTRRTLLESVAGPHRPSGAPVFPGHRPSAARLGAAPALPAADDHVDADADDDEPAHGPAGTAYLVRRAEQHAEQGRFGRAAMLWDEVAEDRARVLGADHPDTLTSRENHARFLGDAGDPGGAARLTERVAWDRARVLGADHPDTLTSRDNHAWYVGEAGDAARGARLMAQVVEDSVRVLGADHPDTLTSRHNHALFVGEAGHAVAAARLMGQVAQDRARALGRDHPATLNSRHHHALSVGRAGDTTEGVRLMALVVEDREWVLGADHPATVISRADRDGYAERLMQQR